MVSVAAQRSFAESLVTPRTLPAFPCADEAPELMDVLLLDESPPEFSRLPL